MRRVITLAGFGLLSFLCLATALFSARFLLPTPVMAEGMASHIHARPVIFMAHVAGGVIALTLGAFQLVTWRGPRRWWHRMAGRTYVAACLTAAVAGLLLAPDSLAGPVSGLGFSLLAVAWFTATGLAWRRAVTGDFARHRRWMIRSLAMTFAAVTLRILLVLAPLTDVDFLTAYRAIAFLSWVPNLILVELWLRVWGWKAAAPRGHTPRNG